MRGFLKRRSKEAARVRPRAGERDQIHQMSRPEPIRLAVVGCGKITELGHMRAIVKERSCKCTLLVDPNEGRTKELAKTFRIERTAADYHAVKEHAEAAILALPHHLHAEVSCDLLRAGIHVLIEKPMAMSAAECEAMNAAAEEGGAVLSVGLQRRFIHSIDFVKQALDQGMLGRLRSFDYREGGIYRWQLVSDFLLRKETAGGGVLFDTGAHALDLLLYWLGEVAEVGYADDSRGGIEADCELRLTMASGVTGEMHLSRTRELRNSVLFFGEHATLEAAPAQNIAVVHPPEGPAALAGFGTMGQAEAPALADLFVPDKKQGHLLKRPQVLDDLYLAQLRDWLEAIRGAHPPKVDGHQAARSIALIERCYAARTPLQVPWMQPEPAKGQA